MLFASESLWKDFFRFRNPCNPQQAFASEILIETNAESKSLEETTAQKGRKTARSLQPCAAGMHRLQNLSSHVHTRCAAVFPFQPATQSAAVIIRNLCVLHLDEYSFRFSINGLEFKFFDGEEVNVLRVPSPR